jgi:glycerol-3-phosphate O-acyltransferase
MSGTAPMFHFNELRPHVLAEVTRRVVEHYRQPGAEPLAYVLNDLAIHEEKRLKRVAPPDTEEDKHRVRRIGKALAQGADEPTLARLLETQVRAYADDIAGSFSMPAYRFATRLLPSVFSLLFTPQDLRHGVVGFGNLEHRLRIDGDLAQLRRLAEEGTLVVVPTHLSNLDSPLVGFALERAGLPPMTYGAGKNLFTSPLTSLFIARLGAYKVDRRLRFGLYKEVLKTFSQVVLESGLHSIFFPGGTRSRSGAIERKLKLGLAGTALSAYIEGLKQGRPRQYWFIPLTLNMPLVLEAETLIEDQLKEAGKNRYIIEDDEFSRFGRITTFARKLLSMEQAIEVRFGAPRDPFGNRVDADGHSLDGQKRRIDPSRYVLVGGKAEHHRGRDEEYTRELGRHIADDFVANASYFPTHIVAAALYAELEKALPGMDLYARLRAPREVAVPAERLAVRVDAATHAIRRGESDGLGRLAERAMHKDGDALVTDALQSFSGYHTRPAAQRRGNEVVLVDRELVLYYRNRLVHHPGVTEALA